MKKLFAIVPAIIILGNVPSFAQGTTVIRIRMRDGVTPVIDKSTISTELFKRTTTDSPHPAFYWSRTVKLNQLASNDYFSQYALPPMEQPELNADTKYQFVFMVSGNKIDLSGDESTPMKPIGVAIQKKLQEGIKFDQTSNIKLVVNIYATEYWDNRGWLNNDSRLHLEAGLFEGRNIFNTIVFSRILKKNESPKDKPPTEAGMGLLGEGIGWQILGTANFIPFPG